MSFKDKVLVFHHIVQSIVMSRFLQTTVKTRLEINSLVKAALTGARSVYSVCGRMAEANPSSDTMSVNTLCVSPISSITSLAGYEHDMLVTTQRYREMIWTHVSVEVPFYLSRGWAPGRWGGWRRWWWRCPSSAPSWCRSPSDCLRRSRSRCCCPLPSHTPIRPWSPLNTGRSSAGGSSPGLMGKRQKSWEESLWEREAENFYLIRFWTFMASVGCLWLFL